MKLLDDASAAIQYNRDLLQSAIDNVGQGIAVFDSEGKPHLLELSVSAAFLHCLPRFEPGRRAARGGHRHDAALGGTETRRLPEMRRDRLQQDHLHS